MNPIVLHICRLVWLLPLLAGCGGGGGGGGGGVGVPTATLRAEPDAFAPGATVTLRPVFGAGVGRIDPGVGPVVSGGAYVVGPVVADATFTLTVTTASGTGSAIVVVPVRYRERVLEAPPSAIARTAHGGALLPDGRVLLVAGSSSGALNWTNTETFRAADGSFAPAGELSAGRSGVAVAAMADGTVFACGGNTNTASFAVATRLEQWDPAAAAWSVRANLACNRSGHTLTPLAGGRLLVMGGIATGGSPGDKDAELYEPGAGMRSPIGQASANRTGHAAVLRPDGTVLILGGVRVETGELLGQAERFVPDAEQFEPGWPLLRPRSGHTAIALPDGSVLLFGGDDAAGPVALAELWPADGSEPVPAGAMLSPRSFARAALLLDGSVLVAGGVLPDGRATDAVEVWLPATRTWRSWQARLPAPRTGHTLHALADGRLALLGGDPGDGFPVPTCWLID